MTILHRICFYARPLIVVFAFSFVASSAFGQRRSDYRGRDFWICIPENAFSENGSVVEPQLAISGKPGTLVDVLLPTAIEHHKVDSTGLLRVMLDASLELHGDDSTSHLGIEIISSADIGLIVTDHRKAITDSYAAIPTSALGTEYRAMGYVPNSAIDRSFSSESDILATANDTHVTIEQRTQDGLTYIPLSVPLKRGEVYQVHSKTAVVPSADITGDLTTSDKPVAFFTGHVCAQIPPDVSYCNVLVEQEPPIEDWGKTFVLPRFEGKAHYSIRVLANEDATDVTLGGLSVANLNAGHFYGTDTLSDPELLTTSKPALVAIYGQSGTADSIPLGDPFMIFVTPVENYVTSSSIGTPEVKVESESTNTGYDKNGVEVHGSRGNPHTLVTSTGKIYNYYNMQTSNGVKQEVEEDTVAEMHPDLRMGVQRILDSIAKPVGRKGTIRTQFAIVRDTSLHVPNPNQTVSVAKPQTPGWQHYIALTLQSNGLGSLLLDGKKPPSSNYKVFQIPGSTYVLVQILVSKGAHALSADEPFEIYAYAFGDFDAYGTCVSQMLKVHTEK